MRLRRLAGRMECIAGLLRCPPSLESPERHSLRSIVHYQHTLMLDHRFQWGEIGDIDRVSYPLLA